jgi:hypothetical protein
MIRREDKNAGTGVVTVETWDVATGYTRTVNGQTVDQRALTAQEAAAVTAHDLEQARPGKIATLATRARAYLAQITTRKTVITADKANAQLTTFVGLAALNGSSTAAQVRDRTIAQDLALKALIAIVNRALTSEDGVLTFARDQIYLDGQLVTELADLLDGEV